MDTVCFSVSIPSDFKWLEWLESILDTILQQYTLDEDNRSFTNLAFHEAVANAIVHGNRGNDALQVNIRFELGGDRFEIYVKDQGEGFDPEAVPDPTQPEFRLNTHGRGLLFMRSFLDELHFYKEKDGMCVRLIKYAKRLSS